MAGRLIRLAAGSARGSWPAPRRLLPTNGHPDQLPRTARPSSAGSTAPGAAPGTITMNTGDKERIRCRVDYPTPAAPCKKLEYRRCSCASDSYGSSTPASPPSIADGSDRRPPWTATNDELTGDVTGSDRAVQTFKAKIRRLRPLGEPGRRHHRQRAVRSHHAGRHQSRRP